MGGPVSFILFPWHKTHTFLCFPLLIFYSVHFQAFNCISLQFIHLTRLPLRAVFMYTKCAMDCGTGFGIFISSSEELSIILTSMFFCVVLQLGMPIAETSSGLSFLLISLRFVENFFCQDICFYPLHMFSPLPALV